MADRAVLGQRLGREVRVLPAVVKQRCQCLGAEPEHTAVGRNGRFFTGNRRIDAKVFHQLFRVFKVRAPAAGAHIHEVKSVRRVRRAENTEVRVLLKLAQHIQHMSSVFADILIADIAKARADTAGAGLDGFFVMHEAGVVIVPQLRGQVTEEGTDVAALVLHHGHGDTADVQVRKGGLDLRLLISTARRDENIRLWRELCRKRLAGIQHIHEIQVHGQRNAAVLADALCRCLVQHRRLDDAGQREIAGKIVRVHRADHVLPDEVHRIVRLVPQIVVQLLHRLTCRVVEIGLQLMHKAAALEQRAFFLPQ